MDLFLAILEIIGYIIVGILSVVLTQKAIAKWWNRYNRRVQIREKEEEKKDKEDIEFMTLEQVKKMLEEEDNERHRQNP